MTYYNQTNHDEVKAMEKELAEDGFNVSVSQATCEVLRETSKYNKYIKWRVITKGTEGGMTASEYFKSKPEALRYLNKPRRPMPIGNEMSLSYYQILP